MTTINAKTLGFSELNTAIREAEGDLTITGCSGQRFISAGMGGRKIDIVDGIPGNALGAYLNGNTIEVFGNAQDAVGDTMNDGTIIVHGNIGDTTGYAMRGGEILVEGNAGYRAGIHMKAYKNKLPVMVIGGHAGSFLGEYQAGGLIIVLNLNLHPGADMPSCAYPVGASPIVGNFPCTGMHGGKMFLRTNGEGIRFPSQVTARKATKENLDEIRPYIEHFCNAFGGDPDELLNDEYIVSAQQFNNP